MADNLQTTFSTGRSTPGAPSTSGDPVTPEEAMTPEEAVDRLLIWTESLLAESKAQELVETLDNVSKGCLPMNWCTQPADDRCCGLAIR